MLLPTDKHINNPLEEEEPYHLEIPLKCTICGSIFKRWDQVSDRRSRGPQHVRRIHRRQPADL